MKTGRESQKAQESKEHEGKIIRTSFFEDTTTLYEQVQHSERGLCFARFDVISQTVSYVLEIPLADSKILPIADELQSKGAILLPHQAEDFSSVQELLEEIRAYINRYCDLSSDFVKFASWYVLLTTVSDKLNTVPYLRHLGDTGTGKSRAVDVIGRICYKPMLATACITPAPIYRMINLWQGTLILEEADMRQSDETNEVIKILNAGFERGKPVLRSTKDNPDSIQVLPVFGPKIFATRRRFDDAALEARCLTEIMKETKRLDIPPLLPKAAFKEQVRIRNKLLMFRFKYRHTIDTDSVLNIDFGDLEPRLRQVAASFAVIFANFPEVLEEFKTRMAKYQTELIETRSVTFEGQVIAAFVECLLSTVTTVTAVTPVTVTASQISEKLPANKNGEHPKAATVGKVLRTLGLVTHPQKIDKKTQRVIKLDKELLLGLIKRYIPKDELEEAVTAVTDVTAVTGDREPLVPLWDDKAKVWLACTFEPCKEMPCNYDSSQGGVPRCPKHLGQKVEQKKLQPVEEAIANA